MRYLAEAPQFKSALVVVPATQSTECSIESALFSVEEESFTKINRFDVGEAKREIDAVSSRYGITGQIDRTKLSSQDRGIIDRLERTVLGPAKHERAFIDDLEDLRALARMAELKFMANTKDVTDSGGNADTVGQTLAKMKLIGREKLALLILNKIDSDFPSDNMKMMRLLQAATKGAIASPGAGRRNQ
jgi:hypothetical protein